MPPPPGTPRQKVVRHSPLRVRLRTPIAARVRLAPDALHRALDRLTRLEGPLSTRVAIDGDLVALTTHDPEQGWFETVAVHGATPARHRRSAAVTVDLLLLREVVEYSRLATSTGADAILTVRDGRAVGLSRWSVAASRVAPPIEVPPGPGGWTRIEEGVAVPAVEDREGTTTFTIPGASVTARNLVLERMHRRDLTAADIYETDGRVFLVATDARDRGGAISLIGAARIVYDSPPR
ncbi:MAG: hypothetical protein R6X23_06320 [Acidimicrobiia bacterium]